MDFAHVGSATNRATPSGMCTISSYTDSDSIVMVVLVLVLNIIRILVFLQQKLY